MVLGQPRFAVRLASDAPLANLCVRLVDLHPDGTATRVSFGVLNLAHRQSNAKPEPMVPGKPTDIEMALDACGYRFAPGHRIRVAVSSAYWPTILPPPTDATLEMELATFKLSLPLLGEHRRIEVAEPADPGPLPHYETLAKGEGQRRIVRDLVSGVTTYRVFEDTGLNRHPGNGLAVRDVREESWSICAGDPLSMAGEARWYCEARREGWDVRPECVSTLACTQTDWLISATVEAFHDGRSIFSRTRTQKVPRDHM